MKTIVNTLLNTLEESTGYWMTNNNDINTDNAMFWKTENTLDIVDCDNDIELHISFDDITGICFHVKEEMTVCVIKTKQYNTILIHSFLN